MRFKQEHDKRYGFQKQQVRSGSGNVCLNANEAAELLGVCRPSLLTACKEGKIPHRRIGRRLVFSEEALRKWVACEE